VKLIKTYIIWSTEFSEKVRCEEDQDKEYKREVNQLLEIDEQEQNILPQEDGIQ
jgi:hypothetical protein